MTLDKNHIANILQLLTLILFVIYDGFSYFDAGAAIKVAYYAVTTMLLIAIVVLNAPNKHSLQRTDFSWWGIMAFIFVTVYLLRILYDLYIVNVPFLMTTHKASIPFLFTCGTIIPLLFLPHFNFANINWLSFSKASYIIFVSMGLYSLYLNLTGQLIDSIFSDGRMVGNASMDTIGFGHLGVTIIIASIAVMQDHKWFWKFMGLITIFIGIVIMLGAGSRGPMVAVLICILTYIYAKGHRVLALFSLPFVILLFYLLFPILNQIFIEQGNFAIERIYNSLFRADEMADPTSLRGALYEEMLDDLLNNPLTGSSFLLKDGQYVHNIVFETFLATGFIGGLIFIILISATFVQSVRLIRLNTCFTFISLLFVQYIVYGFFSRSLSILPIFWFAMYCVIGIGQTYIPLVEMRLNKQLST